MFYVHTFHKNGQRKLGSFNVFVIRDLRKISSIQRRVHFAACLDLRHGYEIEEVPTATPYAEGSVVYRSPQARRLFGEI